MPSAGPQPAKSDPGFDLDREGVGLEPIRGPTSWPRIAQRPHFVSNQGQSEPGVRFQLSLESLLIQFKKNGITLASTAGPAASRWAGPLELSFEGARARAVVEGLERLPGVLNYYRGAGPEGWAENVPIFGGVIYRDLYPDIDLIYRVQAGRLKSEFQIRPGGRPEQILVRYHPCRALELSAEGALSVTGEGISWREEPPEIYQEVDGLRRDVEGAFRLIGRDRIGFLIGPYDRAHPLIIDPILTFSTFLGGGSSIEDAKGVAVDADGNIYVTGFTNALLSFPNTGGPGRGETDVFVSKFHPDTSELVYSVLIGGSQEDMGSDIVLDSRNNVYITGVTSSANFPTLKAFQKTAPSTDFFTRRDAFLTKLDPQGSLIYSTYLGGSNNDEGHAVAVGEDGRMYLCGETVSSDFPLLNERQGYSEREDAFVASLSPDGSRLIYSTYLGGKQTDRCLALAADGQGSAYLAGQTSSDEFPVANAFQAERSNQFDAFVTKLDGSGSTLVFSTYFGGTSSDWATGLTVDSRGDVYIVGETQSDKLPLVNAIQDTLAGSADVFVARLQASGQSLLFSTYLGGSGTDRGRAVALDPLESELYITGTTLSKDFPKAHSLRPTLCNAGSPSPIQGDSADVFVAKLRTDKPALIYSTYLGGGGSDIPNDLSVDSERAAIVVGVTHSADFPTAEPFQGGFGGFPPDTFVARLSRKRLYFAQFGDGRSQSANVSSEIKLLNRDPDSEAVAVIELNDDDGSPLAVDLNGELVNGRTEVEIPAGGIAALRTDGEGPLRVGSVVVTSDAALSGVVLFGGSIGTAGVGTSEPVKIFDAPVLAGPGINTGVALMNVGKAQDVRLELRNRQGNPVAKSQVRLAVKGHLARFLTELPWDTPPDFKSFSGTLTVEGGDRLAATVIVVTEGELSTFPVTDRSAGKIGWREIEQGTDGPVGSLKDFDGILFSGGGFDQAGCTAVNAVAVWNGSWFPLGAAGTSIIDMVFFKGALHAADFAGPVVRREGNSWTRIGSGFSLLAMAVFGDELVVGGDFSNLAGVPANNVARWDGSSWKSAGEGTNFVVNALAVYKGELIVAGRFSQAGGIAAGRIAAWNGSRWAPLGSGVSGIVHALGLYAGELIVGGAFSQAGGVPANNIARWNGSSWKPLGEGISGRSFGVPPEVKSIGLYDGDLVVGGRFTHAGGRPAPYVARWNGTTWSDLAGGIVGTSSFTSVNALVESDGDLFAGGFLEVMKGKSFLGRGIARLNDKLFFPQFADGGDGPASVSSSILLNNLADQAAEVEVFLRDDQGDPLVVDLNGAVMAGRHRLVIPPRGMAILATDGAGPLIAGSATVRSDQSLEGVILFQGPSGSAGVQSSELIPKGFEAPMEVDSALNIKTGVAVMNPQTEGVFLNLTLVTADGRRLATARLMLEAMGHRAFFADLVAWQPLPGVVLDFTDFSGKLQVRYLGSTAATVIRTEPGIFATQPVVPL